MATVDWQEYADGGFYKASVDGLAAATSGLSTIVNLKGYLLTTIYMPSSWTTAALTFLLSQDGSTFLDFNDYYGEVSYSSTIAVASKALGVEPKLAAQMQGAVKLRSGTASAAVNQASSRTITLIAMKLKA